MKHWTIRWNSDKSVRIITLSKKFMEILVSNHPRVIHLFIARLLSELKTLTGNNHAIDYDQDTLLSEICLGKVKTDVNIDVFRLDEWISNGFKVCPLSEDVVGVLSSLSLFYNQFYPM